MESLLQKLFHSWQWQIAFPFTLGMVESESKRSYISSVFFWVSDSQPLKGPTCNGPPFMAWLHVDSIRNESIINDKQKIILNITFFYSTFSISTE